MDIIERFESFLIIFVEDEHFSETPLSFIQVFPLNVDITKTEQGRNILMI